MMNPITQTRDAGGKRGLRTAALLWLAGTLLAAETTPAGRLIFQGIVSSAASSSAATGTGMAPGPSFRAGPGTYTLFSLSSLLVFPEIYHDFVPRPVELDTARPIITSIAPYPGDGPEGLAENGALAEIRGRHLDDTIRVEAGGKQSLPLVVDASRVIARLGGMGTSRVRVLSSNGLWSPPVTACLIRVTAENGPPARLSTGEAVDAVLKIHGTDLPLGMRLEAESDSVSLDGASRVRISSSGGSPNLVRFTITAEHPGPYRIFYRLSGSQPDAAR